MKVRCVHKGRGKQWVWSVLILNVPVTWKRAESISLNIPFKVTCDSKSPSSRESRCTASHLIYFLTFTGRFSNMQSVIEYKIPAEMVRTAVISRYSERLRISAILTGLNVTHVAVTLFVYTLCSLGITCPIYSTCSSRAVFKYTFIQPWMSAH